MVDGDCDDNANCTIDTCDPGTNTCAHLALNVACDDAQFCNGVETCNPAIGQPITGCALGVLVNCGDGIGCTIDACDEATDSCKHTANNAACNDGQYCNGVETCNAAVGCQAGVPVVCNDGLSCTTDVCSNVAQACTFTPNNAACDDGLDCNGQETCVLVGGAAGTGCMLGAPIPCGSDGIACTVDACNEGTNACEHTPTNALCPMGQTCVPGAGGCTAAMPCVSNAQCNDGNACNGVETCNVVCQPGSPVNCDDGFSCTIDSCNPASGVCAHTPNNLACDDGAFCDGTETCDPANGAAVTGCTPNSGSPCDDGVACTVDACNDVTDTCSHTTSDALCANAILCDGTEFCNALFGCMSTGAPSCSDNVSCTADFCDAASDSCKHVNQDAVCSDGLFCDGAEVCNPAIGNPVTGCAPGVAVNCNDNVACTADACNEATNACDHQPNSAMCSDGLFCNGSETCVVGVGCQAGAPVVCNDNLSCTSDACSNAAAACVFTPNNAACSDGLDCNGQETCALVGGAAGTGCKAGAPIPCGSDGIACTVDACNEVTNTCDHTASNGLCPVGQFCVPAAGGCTAAMPCNTNADCSDGNACNGAETCNVTCKPGVPINCDDGFGCTVDACNPANGACTHSVNNAFCDDGAACNGVETCSAQSGCVAGAPINCSDGVDCTEDFCNDQTGACSHVAQNLPCSDGVFCNGTEVCTPAGCAAGAPPTCNDGIACTTDVCDPILDACNTTPNNALCACGQTCNAALGGCSSTCTVSTCQGKVYQCGDCLDNDGDCQVDVGQDAMCLGPCDNTEDSFYGGIPGQNNSPCKSDCYFDQDTGAGNDDCYWSHKCDPYEVPPNYPPETSQCAYNPNANIPGYNGTCATAFSTQSATCLGYCGPLTPNGCDCFGCCAIPGAPTTVWLGSENPAGTGSCTLDALNDPTKCKPCTQVAACLNTCELCELCVGKPTLPPGCLSQDCAPGVQKCGLAGQAPCPEGYFCNTGCCTPNPL